ncbi:hypothetical protein BB560_001262 [Smittium megazygosporum]|uniref:Uncharacterized protein n=1 Tax=Smittium megazygosporum TaxID=133381 RepID=A0A2T9ZI44_9FUNG|nr:hypothetical protein BB560_001262 [Smittium megazygosporum]
MEFLAKNKQKSTVHLEFGTFNTEKFTKDDVEIMRAMWVRKAKRSYRFSLLILTVILAFFILSGIYMAVFSSEIFGENFNIVVVLFLSSYLLTLLMVSYFIIKTKMKYQKRIKVLTDNSTPSQVILSGITSSGFEKDAEIISIVSGVYPKADTLSKLDKSLESIQKTSSIRDFKCDTDFRGLHLYYPVHASLKAEKATSAV